MHVFLSPPLLSPPHLLPFPSPLLPPSSPLPSPPLPSKESTISIMLELDSNDMDCRRWCAYNAPAVVLLCPTKHYDAHLHSSIVQLAGDPSSLVRRQFATGFHEVCVVLCVKDS